VKVIRNTSSSGIVGWNKNKCLDCNALQGEIIIQNHGTAIDGVASTPEYLHAKRLFLEKKALQARLRQVNSMLRQLQLLAGAAVNLA
jgi:hypothetical protein